MYSNSTKRRRVKPEWMRTNDDKVVPVTNTISNTTDKVLENIQEQLIQQNSCIKIERNLDIVTTTSTITATVVNNVQLRECTVDLMNETLDNFILPDLTGLNVNDVSVDNDRAGNSPIKKRSRYSTDNCSNATNEITTNKLITSVNTTEKCNISKRVLRSSAPFNLENHTVNNDKKSSTITKDLPFIKYDGKVKYLTTFHDIAYEANNILEWINEQHNKTVIPIAFDMEWPFSFQTGPGRSAVIQLCADINICYLFHISELKKLPISLLDVLMHDKVRLHGVNIKCDCRKLERDFPEVNAQKMIDQCRDLGPWCNEVQNTIGRWSMERLVLRICKLRINKDKSVRHSKWHIMPLSEAQQLYAAIDVYISQVMYYELEKQEIENNIKLKEFEEKYGTKALKEINKLL